MKREDRPCQNPNAAWRELEGEVFIISPQDSVLHDLNGTASFIWKLATGQRTVEEIAELLAAEYEVAGETALADTEELIAHLEANKLLLPSPRRDLEVSHG